jgi:hypothetical protein
MKRSTRISLTAVASVVGFALVLLFVVPSGCNESGGAPSWERCTTIMGTPAVSVEDLGLDATLNVIPPLVAAVLVGFGFWRILGRSDRNDARRS